MIDARERPALTASMSGSEFLRWYWLHEELRGFARTLGVRSAGGKRTLTARIAARLDGVLFVEEAGRASRRNRLVEPLTADSILPAGQSCTQSLRAWFVDQVGPAFHFDGAMRRFIAEGDGTRTLGDALVEYRRTRNTPPTDIDDQFEYNRFTRDWNETRGGTRKELFAAWREYRAQPIDARERRDEAGQVPGR